MSVSKLFSPGMIGYAIQRICTWYPLRRRLASFVASGRPNYEGVVPSGAAPLILELERDGVTRLPGFVDTATVRRISDHLVGAELRERFPPGRAGFTLDTVPQNVHVAEYSTEQILKCPDVVAIANHPLLLAVAARYLGCKPTISNLSIWWSLPADGTAQEAENFHRDVDDWRFVKLFVYLNDVDADGGPHCFVRGSHRSWRFLRKRRLEDARVAAVFPQHDMLQIGGSTGDAFLEDTFGLHKGQPPRLKRRLLLQVEYSINPIAVYQYSPRVPAFGSATAIDAYVNRLFVQGTR